MYKRTSFAARMVVLLVGLIAIAACEITDPTEGVTLFLDYEAGNTYVNGTIIDARTGETIKSTDVTATVFGPDAGEVRGVEGARKNEFEPESGTFSFVLQKAVSKDDPADVRVRVRAEGYLETTEPLQVIDENASFQVTLVAVSQAGEKPSGVNVEENEEGSASSTGEIQEDYVVEAEDDVAESSTTITLKKGTRLTDVDGQELRGQLKTRVVNFKGTDESAQVAFPGGFMGVNVKDQTAGGSKRAGAESSGTFMTAGYTAIEITDEQGRQARHFDRGVEVRMDIPADTKHPEENRDVREGDIIPVYSFESDTGEWRFEGKDTVEVNQSTGKLYVDYTTTHLSYFNLDWFYSAQCRSSQPVSFTGMRQGYRWELRRESDGRYLKSGPVPGGADDELRFLYAPQGMPARLWILKQENGEWTRQPELSPSIADLCASPTAVALPPPPEPLITLSVDVSLTCEADGRGAQVRPSYPLHVREVTLTGSDRGVDNISGYPNGSDYTTYTMRKGSLVIPDLKETAYYQTTVYYEGEEYTRIFNIDRDKGSTSIEVDGTTYALADYGVTVEQTSDTQYDITMAYDIAEGGEAGGFCD